MVDEARQELGERLAHGVRAQAVLLGEFLHLGTERLLNLARRDWEVLARSYPGVDEVPEAVLLECLDQTSQAAALAHSMSMTDFTSEDDASALPPSNEPARLSRRPMAVPVLVRGRVDVTDALTESNRSQGGRRHVKSRLH